MHRDQIYNFVRHHLRHIQDSEDITQEVFIKVWKSIHRFRQRSKFSTWVYRIAYHMIVDVSRRPRRREYSTFKPPEPIPVTEKTADKEAVVWLYEAVRKLPLEDQILLFCRHHEKMGCDEIGEILGIRAATCRKRYERAIEKLRGMR